MYVVHWWQEIGTGETGPTVDMGYADGIVYRSAAEANRKAEKFNERPREKGEPAMGYCVRALQTGEREKMQEYMRNLEPHG